MLQNLGLDTTAESVYRAILAHPQEGVAELRGRLGLGEEEMGTALDHLSELALVRPSAEDPRQLHAVGPHLGMEILLARQQADLASRQTELAAMQQRVEISRAAAARLISEFASDKLGASEAGVLHLDGIDNIRDYLTKINSEVKEEFLAFAPGGPQTPQNLEASRPLNQRLLERGVRMRTIYLDSIRNAPASVTHAEWLTSLGGEVRTVPSLPNRMIIYDRRVAIIAADYGNTAAGAAVISAQGIVVTLCALFESTWEDALPLGVPAQRGAGELTPQHAEALRLLAQGHTDQAVANRLGVSARTARRIATDLMVHLDARSRFQAGVIANQRGYLSP